MKRINPPSSEPTNPSHGSDAGSGPSKSPGAQTAKENGAASNLPDKPVLKWDATSQTENKNEAPPPKPSSKPAVKDLPVPPILLEGDDPPARQKSGPGQKFTGPQQQQEKASSLESVELPESYGTGRLLLVARDPDCLYAHWDVSKEQQQQYAAQSPAQTLLVRVHQQDLQGAVIAEQPFPSATRSAFVRVDSGSGQYVAQIGFYPTDHHWQTLAQSEPAVSPGSTTAPRGPDRFARLSFPVPDLTAALSSPAALTRSAEKAVPGTASPTDKPVPNLDLEFPLVRTIPSFALQAIGPAEPVVPEVLPEEEQMLPESSTFPPTLPTPSWSPAKERALARFIGSSLLRQQRIGSAEFEAMVRSGVGWGGLLAADEVSSVLSSQAVAPTPSGEAQAFWFNVNAELVIYGATDPNATVTIGGRKIPLRPDGSFSLRFSLPDGSYQLPVEAISTAGDRRKAELQFYRGSVYSGEVGQHPPASQLAAPKPENVS